ncbi:hypothetical protein F5Y13DRAFT_193547 [Hypoxylon sp. FL1857]|nr:hypothetical protein F5Y13DRAFT_193547 [Hypoxylon sp. FL1857]
MAVWKRACYTLLILLLLFLQNPVFAAKAKSPKTNAVKSPNYYEVLGVPLFSSEEDLEIAYRQQLKIHGADEVKEREITQAYNFLTSRERCIYDFGLGSSPADLTACQDKYGKKATEEFMKKREQDRKEREEARRAQREKGEL